MRLMPRFIPWLLKAKDIELQILVRICIQNQVLNDTYRYLSDSGHLLSNEEFTP